MSNRRMWGNPNDHHDLKRRRQPIPTHVGKPAVRDSNSFRAAVYPHACGETWRRMLDEYSDLGLSPRMWGNQF